MESSHSMKWDSSKPLDPSILSKTEEIETKSKAFFQHKKQPSQVRRCDGKTIVAVVIAVTSALMFITGLVMAILHGNSATASGLMGGGIGVCLIEALIICMYRRRAVKHLDEIQTVQVKQTTQKVKAEKKVKEKPSQQKKVDLPIQSNEKYDLGISDFGPSTMNAMRKKDLKKLAPLIKKCEHNWNLSKSERESWSVEDLTKAILKNPGTGTLTTVGVAANLVLSLWGDKIGQFPLTTIRVDELLAQVNRDMKKQGL